MKQLRNEWTDYAKKHGLIGESLGLSENLLVVPEKRPKYGNLRMEVDGHVFDSRKEAARFQELKLMQQAKQIADLELQPVFPLHVMELYRSGPIYINTVGIFKADFRYVDLVSGEIVVEDVKSEWTKNTAYQLRKRIAEAVHGIYVREV